MSPGRDARPADIGRDLELADHAIHENVEMQLAHAGDAGLAALLVRVDAEGGVFIGQALKGESQLVLIGLGLGSMATSMTARGRRSTRGQPDGPGRSACRRYSSP